MFTFTTNRIWVGNPLEKELSYLTGKKVEIIPNTGIIYIDGIKHYYDAFYTSIWMNIVLDTDIPKEYILKPNGYFSFDVIKDNKIIYHGRLSDIYKEYK